MSTGFVKYFTYNCIGDDGIPLYRSEILEKLRDISNPICDLAKLMEEKLPDGPEKSAGMRKLMEAKDCFVRARM